MITWNYTNGKLIETSDSLTAIKTTISNILTIPCTKYDIFSWKYGNQLLNILGNTDIESKINKYIESALLNDDRILSVYDIIYTKENDKLYINFKVETDFGVIGNEVIL